MFLLILVHIHFTTRFRSEVLYSNRLRQDMVASVMKRSGHLTTMAMFSMAGLAIFIGYILKNVQFLMSQPPCPTLVHSLSFLQSGNFSSFQARTFADNFIARKSRISSQASNPWGTAKKPSWTDLTLISTGLCLEEKSRSLQERQRF